MTKHFCDFCTRAIDRDGADISFNELGFVWNWKQVLSVHAVFMHSPSPEALPERWTKLELCARCTLAFLERSVEEFKRQLTEASDQTA